MQNNVENKTQADTTKQKNENKIKKINKREVSLGNPMNFSSTLIFQ